MERKWYHFFLYNNRGVSRRPFVLFVIFMLIGYKIHYNRLYMVVGQPIHHTIFFMLELILWFAIVTLMRGDPGRYKGRWAP